MKQGWLMLVYRVPSEPSTHRVQIWRKVKALGGVFLQNSVCVMPMDRLHERDLRKLEHEIAKESGGQAYFFKCEHIGSPTTLEKLFNHDRNEEYTEIIHRCEEFLVEMEKETKDKHFSFAEMEENEVDLTKLDNWLAKVKKRDFFDAPKRAEAENLMRRCHDRLAIFSDQVFKSADSDLFDTPVKPGRK